MHMSLLAGQRISARFLLAEQRRSGHHSSGGQSAPGFNQDAIQRVSVDLWMDCPDRVTLLVGVRRDVEISPPVRTARSSSSTHSLSLSLCNSVFGYHPGSVEGIGLGHIHHLLGRFPHAEGLPADQAIKSEGLASVR